MTAREGVSAGVPNDKKARASLGPLVSARRPYDRRYGPAFTWVLVVMVSLSFAMDRIFLVIG
jgi:hypothetical protein